jgi:hypothetical protein
MAATHSVDRLHPTEIESRKSRREVSVGEEPQSARVTGVTREDVSVEASVSHLGLIELETVQVNVPLDHQLERGRRLLLWIEVRSP